MARKKPVIHGGSASRRARHVQEGLARGAEHHRAGRYAEAARAYAEALHADPDSVDARALLGGVMLRLGRATEAEVLLRGAVSLDPNHAVAQTNRGRALLALERFDEAASCFLAAVRARDGFVEARLGLARARRGQGDLPAAESELRGLLRDLPRDMARGAHAVVEATALLGATLLDAARPAEAEHALGEALLARPNDARILRDLGGARLGLGDPEGAARLWARAATLDPALAGLHAHRAALVRSIGLRHLAAGEPAALDWLRQAVQLDPESHASRLALCDALFQTGFLPEDPASAELERDLTLLLHAEGIDHQRLERAIRHVLGAVPGVASALNGGPIADALVAHPLFAPWLTRTIVTHPHWWALVGRVHGWLLARKAAGEEVPVAAMEALAAHAWNTEYAAGGASDGAWREATIAEERKLGGELPSLGALEDPTSHAVRAQYEAHPYPRLVGIHRQEPCSFGVYVARAIGRPVEGAASPPRVLVAGGGTGQHPIGVASALAGSEVVCIDLSRASLGRATRLASACCVRNIRFIQGDLLCLAGEAGVSLGLFGFIDCVGVLHHLADPVAGGRALVGRLAPGGMMRLGVYSERGRTEIVAARALVAERGWLPTDEGLREARSGLLALPAAHAAARVTASPDFYTQSGLRDLVFHACEHRYTPSQLAGLVRELGVEVLGLQHARPEGPRLYRARWIEDPDMASLERWDDLEREHPRLFSGMIHVWLRAG